jgi:hypothetical protein
MPPTGVVDGWERVRVIMAPEIGPHGALEVEDEADATGQKVLRNGTVCTGL